MRNTAYLAFALPIVIGLSAAKPAAAQFIITPTFDSTWNTDTNAVADEATITSLLATSFDANFTNPVTVQIDFSNVNTGLGTSLTSGVSVAYSSYLSNLTADKQLANGGDGNTAFLSNLPSSGNPVPNANGFAVSMSTAQARMLNYNVAGGVTVAGQAGSFDSQISLNMTLIGPGTVANGGGYSLTAVSAHEIDEVLGLSSGLNSYNQGTPGPPTTVSGMDFFRYSGYDAATHTGIRSFTNSTTAVSYFSDDGGKTPIVYFNQAGDGSDYQDWASGDDATTAPGTVVAAAQVQDAFGTSTENPSLGPSEFEALNDIGWNRSPNAVPEASTTVSFGLLLVLGMGGMVVAAKRLCKKMSA